MEIENGIADISRGMALSVSHLAVSTRDRTDGQSAAQNQALSFAQIEINRSDVRN